MNLDTLNAYIKTLLLNGETLVISDAKGTRKVWMEGSEVKSEELE